MKITKGEKTITDYILRKGLDARYFSYGWLGEKDPSIYQVKGIDCECGNGSEAVLKVVRIDGMKKGKEESLNLAVHRKDLEVFLS